MSVDQLTPDEMCAAALQALVKLFQAEVVGVNASLTALGAATAPSVPPPSWYIDLLDHLAAELMLAVGRLLPLEASNHNLPIAAFCARSLVELNVWAAFCARSEADARKFREDRYRDGLGLHDACIQLAGLAKSTLPKEFSTVLTAFVSTLKSMAAMDGLPVTGQAYMKVALAAEVLGLADAFSTINRILSKFAHPTAMLVQAFIVDQLMLDRLFVLFKAWGLFCALIGLRSLALPVKRAGIAVPERDPQPPMGKPTVA